MAWSQYATPSVSQTATLGGGGGSVAPPAGGQGTPGARPQSRLSHSGTEALRESCMKTMDGSRRRDAATKGAPQVWSQTCGVSQVGQ